MSSLKLNQIGFGVTTIVVLAIGAVQGCSSSSDDQAAPTAGTSSNTGGKGGTSSNTGGKGGGTSGGTSNNGGSGGDMTMGEGGAAGAGPGGMCEAAEDHGEAAYLAAHNNKLPTL